jgi:hypothetical protein
VEIGGEMPSEPCRQAPVDPTTAPRANSSRRDRGFLSTHCGQVVGRALVADNWHGFIYSDDCAATVVYSLECVIDLFEYLPSSINNSGDVVGHSYLTGRPFLYSKGRITDLSSRLPSNSGWHLVVATDINDHGQIAGYGVRNGKVRAILLTPVR